VETIGTRAQTSAKMLAASSLNGNQTITRE